MAGYCIAAVILLAAAAILIRRIRRFVRTGGSSACDSCPYSGGCAGGHCAAHERKPNTKR